MPSDISGVHVYDEARAQFEFRRGSLFAAVLLVDEINRAGPKTQSALLEAMEERQGSTEREVWPLPGDFLVIATQNPHEYRLLYTSDAADQRTSVDFGGRRNIQKKKKIRQKKQGRARCQRIRGETITERERTHKQ